MPIAHGLATGYLAGLHAGYTASKATSSTSSPEGVRLRRSGSPRLARPVSTGPYSCLLPSPLTSRRAFSDSSRGNLWWLVIGLPGFWWGLPMSQPKTVKSQNNAWLKFHPHVSTLCHQLKLISKHRRNHLQNSVGFQYRKIFRHYNWHLKKWAAI